MKRTVLNCVLILLSIFVFKAVSAQNNVFKTGVQLGVNASQIGGDNYYGFNKAGIYGGAFVNYSFEEKWYLQFEINYIQDGSRHNPNPQKGDFKQFLARLDYVQVPLSVGFEYSKRFTFELGGYYGRLVHLYIENQNGVVDTRYIPIKKRDIGALIGLFVNLSPRLAAHARFFTSVLPTWTRNSASQNIGIINELTNRGWYNTCITLSLAYKINL